MSQINERHEKTNDSSQGKSSLNSSVLNPGSNFIAAKGQDFRKIKRDKSMDGEDELVDGFSHLSRAEKSQLRK